MKRTKENRHVEHCKKNINVTTNEIQARDQEPYNFTIDAAKSNNNIFNQMGDYYNINIETIWKESLCNGYVNCTDNTIAIKGNPTIAGFIPASPFRFDYDSKNIETEYASIVNTINNGFRFASVAVNGDTIDHGPVNVPCIVGNAYRPQGLYTPLHDLKSIHDSIEYLSRYSRIVVDVNKETDQKCNLSQPIQTALYINPFEEDEEDDVENVEMVYKIIHF